MTRAQGTRPRLGATSPVRAVVAFGAIAVGLVLVFGWVSVFAAEGVFVGTISVALAIYIAPGVTGFMARVVAGVLLLVGAYAIVRGFELWDLAVLRQVGGIVAIACGVILLVPLVRARTAPDRLSPRRGAP